MKFNRQQSIKIVEFYFANNKSPIIASRVFNTWKRNNSVPCPNAHSKDVQRVVRRLSQKGSILRNNKGNSGRLRSARTPLNTLRVLAQ